MSDALPWRGSACGTKAYPTFDDLRLLADRKGGRRLRAVLDRALHAVARPPLLGHERRAGKQRLGLARCQVPPLPNALRNAKPSGMEELPLGVLAQVIEQYGRLQTYRPPHGYCCAPVTALLYTCGHEYLSRAVTST